MFPTKTAPQMTPFGQIVETPKHREGIVDPEHVGDLIAACEITDERGYPPENFSLPFAGHGKREGERWHLRIDAPAAHNVDGHVVTGCRWAFALAAGGYDPNR